MRDHVANGAVALVAKDHLRIETLETRGMDNLDFHEVGVGDLRSALLDAYGRGTCRGASDTMARLVAVLSRECSPELQADLLNAFLGCEDNSALSDEEADAGAEFFQCMADVFSGEVVDLAMSGGREAPKDPEWQSMESAPRDGREILCTDGERVRVCRPKRFPRPLSKISADVVIESMAGDREYFRDDDVIPGHSWSMVPIGWMPVPKA